jgi:hypothetical protein
MPEESIIEAVKQEDQVPVVHFIKVHTDEVASPSPNKFKGQAKTTYLKDYNSSDTDSQTPATQSTHFDETSEDSDNELYAFPIERTTRNLMLGR